MNAEIPFRNHGDIHILLARVAMEKNIMDCNDMKRKNNIYSLPPNKNGCFYSVAANKSIPL